MKQLLNFLIFSFLLIACGPQERISKSVFDEVNSSMEAKKLSDSDITQEAMIWGDSISSEAQQKLMESLHQAVSEKGTFGAVAFCDVNAGPIVKDLSDKYGVSIRRTSTKARNQANLPTEEELPILEAYQYNAENGIENNPNIQKIEGGEILLYTKAIVISSEFCLACHGSSNEIEASVLSKIDSIYSEDMARDFNVGDLRGMWSLRLPKKSVVNRL
ncbi:uncharacterized protein DUF3365 [Algoriphagus ratkowskyi]|uniref:DUF3365 domain-containing protein n=1 Tax=Algoriphagus ratkowskyi TaxID=57028 RepID=A0A2W7RBQ5_9BACT|nr:DUF3365 domain-containing protein [Algoriphagus ratkowskyi]PZX58433.1 uncharacterized protein DUF3365 [Algoriphagus ratkowskyi]TXD77700.1 DUF3365 domain-containing protein [Algoriphagus ratkowskyi]